MAELSPAVVLRPLLDLVRLEHASSTLTAAALEATRRFVATWPLSDAAAGADALADVVDAVSQCRFHATSAESDQRVVVLVVAVLRAVLASPAAPSLSDHAMWQLLEALYALSRTSRHDVRRVSYLSGVVSRHSFALVFVALYDAVAARVGRQRAARRRPLCFYSPSRVRSPSVGVRGLWTAVCSQDARVSLPEAPPAHH